MSPINNDETTARRETMIPTARGPVASIVEKLSHEDHVRLRQLLSEPIEYLNHDCFTKSGTAHELFSAVSDSTHRAQPWCNLADLGAMDEEKSFAKSVTLSS